LISLLAIRAHAGPSDQRALAEQLFSQARDLAKAGRWADACPKFEASLRYEPALGTRLNLATCYEHVGKIASAWSLYHDSIELARRAGDLKRLDYAEKQAAALEPRLPQLTVHVPGRPPAGLVVRRDDTPLDPATFGAVLNVDPGTHRIVAAAPGFEPFAQTVTLAESKTVTLAIPDLKPVAGPVPVPATPRSEQQTMATEPAAVIAPSPTRRYVALGIGAGGVVASGVGLVFGAKARSTYGDAQALCGASLRCSPTDYDRGNHLIGDARSSAAISTVLVVAGGAAIAAGVVLWLTAPALPHEVATVRIVPVADDRSAGLAVIGGF
jgi:hypothetical protein